MTLHIIGCDIATGPDHTVVHFGLGGMSFTIAELTQFAARAKAKVKASARGWSMLSQEEILALAWFADQFLEDAEPVQPTPARPAGATNLGMRMTEQMTLLGMMQQQMQAGEAGTALRAFATNAARAHEKFSDMQVTADRPVRVRILDENGQLRQMPDILADLKARYGETLDAFEAAEIKDAFGTDEAMKMINALYGQEEAVRANAAALQDAARQGKEFTETMAEQVDNYDGAGWEKFQQQLKTIKEQIGAGLLPAMDGLAETFGGVAAVVGDFAAKNPVLISTLGGLVVGIGALAGIVAPTAFALSSLVAGFGAVKLAVMAVSRVLIANPIGLAVAAIAGAAYLIYQNWEPIKAFFSGLWEGVKSFTLSAWEGLKSAFLNYTPHGLIIQHWDKIGPYFGGLWEGVKSTFSTKWAEIKATAAGWATDFLTIGGDILTGLSNGITSGVQSVVDTISGIGDSIVSTFKGILGIASPSKVFASFGGFLMEGLVAGLKAKIADVKNAINGIGSSVVGWFKDKLGIASPSKVFAGLGGHLSEGLAVGIDRQKGMVFNSMEGIRRDLAKPMLANATLGATIGATAFAGSVAAHVPTRGSAFNGIDQAATELAGAVGNAVTVSFAPVYHLALSGEIGPDQEERLRQILQEHDREQRFELERLLND